MSKSQSSADETESMSSTSGHSVASTSDQNDADSIISDQSSEGLDDESVEDVENPFSTFTVFPNLPVELQRMVWREACCVTRNLVLDIRKAESIRYQTGWEPYRFYSPCPVPVVLRVCKQSRTEAFKHYTLEFEAEDVVKTVSSPEEINFKIPATIYINWNFDRICMFGLDRFEVTQTDRNTHRLRGLKQKFEKKGLRHLALELETPQIQRHSGFHQCQKALLPLSEDSLEELVLFKETGIKQFSFERHGPFKFTRVSQTENDSFELAIKDIWQNLKKARYLSETPPMPSDLYWAGKLFKHSSETPPMPFNIYCSKLLFEREDPEQSEKKSNDAGRGTVMVLKGETRMFKAGGGELLPK